jgi:hypothetical protein
MIKPMRDINTVVNEVRSTGLSIIPNFIDAESLPKINNEFDLSLKNVNLNKPYSLGEHSIIPKYLAMGGIYPTIKAIFYNKWFGEIAETFYGSKTFELNEDLFVVKDVVGSKHIAQNLHFDVLQTLKFFLYLNDVTAKNGAFTCVPGSHLWTKEKRKTDAADISYGNREYTRDLPDLGEPVPVEGSAGTLIIFDTDLFHKTGTVEVGERRVIRGHTRFKVSKWRKLPSIINFFSRLKNVDRTVG